MGYLDPAPPLLCDGLRGGQDYCRGECSFQTNSFPLGCFHAISLLGPRKMEENKENDLRPPLPQSYAATVARQSTTPSTSSMPGESELGVPAGG